MSLYVGILQALSDIIGHHIGGYMATDTNFECMSCGEHGDRSEMVEVEIAIVCEACEALQHGE